jgi:hypothetical protein
MPNQANMSRSWSSLIAQSKSLQQRGIIERNLRGVGTIDVERDEATKKDDKMNKDFLVERSESLQQKNISTPNLIGLGSIDVVVEKDEATNKDDKVNNDFKSQFKAEEMRSVALVAHNHMKPAMKKFVMEHKAVLSKFRLTGTGTTMKMLMEVFGKDHMVSYQSSFLRRSITETSTPQSYSRTMLSLPPLHINHT